MLDVGVFLLKVGEKLHKTRLSQVEVSFKGNSDKGLALSLHLKMLYVPNAVQLPP